MALASPGALAFSAAGFVGRLQIAMFSLGAVLLVSAQTGHYGVAGGVSAAAAAGYAVVSPLVARAADRRGQGRVLRPLIMVFAVSTAGLIAGVLNGAPTWTLVLSSGVAGATTPQMGSMVRARWSALLGGSALVHTAYSLESVFDEVIFVVGPILVVLLATEIHPAAGIATAGGTCVVGTLVFAAQTRSEPPVERVEPRGEATTRSWARLVPAPGLVTMVPVFVAFGAMLAAIDLATLAFAADHGDKPLAGVILGGYAFGSALGGLWYGSRQWRSPLRLRFTLTLCAAAAGTATFWAMPGLLALGLVMVLSGLVLSPIMISGFSIIEQQAKSGRLTEGIAWLTSAISVGTAAGSAAAGQVIDLGGARWGYGLAAAAGAVAALVCLAGITRLDTPPAGAV